MPLLILELIILSLIFWGICFLNTGSDEKNIKSYASYPDEIQKIVKENPKLWQKIKSVSPVVSFASNILVFDRLWWRNSKRIRFEGTKDRSELYSNPKKHFISFLKGIALFMIIALIDGLILTIIN